MIKPNTEIFKYSFGLFIAFIIGAMFGSEFFNITKNSNNAEATMLRANNSQYSFANPLLACNSYEKSEYIEFHPLETKIQEFIDKEIKADQVNTVSVYFRDLETGRWVGINENKQFKPASLLKVPIMMAAFRRADSDSEFLGKKVLYKTPKSEDIKDGFYKLQNGKYYSINDLLRAMIIDSDNGAKDQLSELIGDVPLKEAFTELGIQLPQLENQDYEISTKTFSLFFRILYNATFLNSDSSENALKLLSESNFKSGIVAGVPDNIKVAHKFGINGNRGGEALTDIELHDCGIVYHRPHPYVLCVMTKGKNTKELTQAISGISSIAYDTVEKDYYKFDN